MEVRLEDRTEFSTGGFKRHMNVNHVNLTVTDAQAARRFFERYFGLVAMDGTTDAARFIGLRDEAGFVLTLMQPTDPGEVS